jgi:hypothetical protein
MKLNWLGPFSFRFDRDWKKIEDFVGSKTVIQVWIICFGFAGSDFYYLIGMFFTYWLYTLADSESCAEILSEGPEEWYNRPRASSSP